MYPEIDELLRLANAGIDYEAALKDITTAWRMKGTLGITEATIAVEYGELILAQHQQP